MKRSDSVSGPFHVKRIALAPIRAYQRWISPSRPRRCKYEPTCSAYAAQAIGRYGILRGLILGVWRVLRCNPWSHGGFDPVEAQTLFRQPEPPSSPRVGGPESPHA